MSYKAPLKSQPMLLLAKGRIMKFGSNLRIVILAGVSSLFLSVSTPLKSQTFAIDWFSIDGGGGTSSGGSYTLIGTIGQPDAGTLSGGDYVLEGGFLSGIYVIQTLDAPLLAIQKSGTNAVLSWPVDALGFLLEETSDLMNP